MANNLALFFGNLFGYFKKIGRFFSKSSGHPAFDPRMIVRICVNVPQDFER